MKIETTKEWDKPKSTQFSELNYGEFFIHNSYQLCLCVKTQTSYVDKNAWNYSIREFMRFVCTDEVIPIQSIKVILPPGVPKIEIRR
jgi:hypothetical protein